MATPDYLDSQGSTACSLDPDEKNSPSCENAKLLLTKNPFGFPLNRRNPEFTKGGMGDGRLSNS